MGNKEVNQHIEQTRRTDQRGWKLGIFVSIRRGGSRGQDFQFWTSRSRFQGFFEVCLGVGGGARSGVVLLWGMDVTGVSFRVKCVCISLSSHVSVCVGVGMSLFGYLGRNDRG